MGAHVWGPAYLRDHLLPHGRLTGWTPDWYAGFPAFQFYMLPPALLIILLNVVLPYGIAFKLVTVLGVLTLPLAAYVMGRLFRMPFPGPPLLAVATVPYLFDRTWTIYGGNIASTLAGRVQLLDQPVAGPGVLRGAGPGPRERQAPRPGRGPAGPGQSSATRSPPSSRWSAAPCCVLLRLDRKRILFAAPVLVARAACSRRSGRCRSCCGAACSPTWAGRSSSGTRPRCCPTPPGGCSSSPSSASSCRWPSSSASARSSPCWRCCRPWGSGSTPPLRSTSGTPACCPSSTCRSTCSPPWACRRWCGRSRCWSTVGPIDAGGRPRALGAVVGLVAVLIVVALPLHALPGGSLSSDGTYSWMGIHTKDDSFVDSWAKWNYSGYEGKDAYPEYRVDRHHHGQGGPDRRLRAGALGVRAATSTATARPMALMLLPFWTNGCIGSMEGLYFESSATTPFHFLNASELSVGPSNPVRDLPDRPMPYSPFNLDKGVRHLQLMGVKYYMAFSDQAIAGGRQGPGPHPGRVVGAVEGLRGGPLRDRRPAHVPARGAARDVERQPRVGQGRGRLVHRPDRPRRRAGPVRARPRGSGWTVARRPNVGPCRSPRSATSSRATCRSASTSIGSVSRSS